jgi:hypothetical protein
MISRSSLGWFAGLMSIVLMGCPGPDPVPDPEGELVIEVVNPVAELDPTYPDQPARLDFDVTFSFDGVAPDQATVTVRSVELEGPGGIVSDGLGARFLDGASLVDAIEVSAAGRAVAAQITGLDNASAPTLCGGPIQARLLFHSTHCDCETEAVADIEPRCSLDNRGADLLTLPLRAATDRPCEVSVGAAGASSTQRFGYDDDGRLEIVDRYIGSTLLERRVFRYGANGRLSEVLHVSPSSGTIDVRRAYTYDEGGALVRIESDGALDESVLGPDGTPDVVSAYTLGSGRWDVSTQYHNTGRSSVSMLTFDLAGRTFQTAELEEPVSTYSYETDVTDPNVFVALPELERLFALRLQSGSGGGDTLSWSWDAARVLSETVASASSTQTATYSYDCP